MNCPMHNLVFRSRGRSYRELPMRLFEFGAVYRYEKSGVVHGLTRVRGLTMDDAHIYCTKEQMPGELTSVLSFILDLLRDYGLEDFYLELSTRDDSAKFIGEDADWEWRPRRSAGRRRVGPRTGARPGRRGVLRAEDLGAGEGRDRADLADVDGPAGLQPAPAVRARVPGRGRLATQAGDDPPGAVRVDRAVLGRAHRALRRCAAGVAGPGAGRRDPDQRGARRVPRAGRGQVGARRIRVEIDAAATGCRRRSAGAATEGAVHAGGGRRDVAANAVSFRYRNGVERHGVPIDEAITEIARRRDPRPGRAASAPRPQGSVSASGNRIPMYSRPHGET